jgi:hypothetical protein
LLNLAESEVDIALDGAATTPNIDDVARGSSSGAGRAAALRSSAVDSGARDAGRQQRRRRARRETRLIIIVNSDTIF